MKKKSIAIVLTALAVLCIGAGSAQASAWTATGYPASISGEQVGPPGTGGGSGWVVGFEGKLMTECGIAGLSGELSGPSSTLAVTPTGGGGCLAFGFLSAEMKLNGCGYVFHAGSGSKDEFGGTMDIACPAGAKIQIIGGTCEVQIGAQTGLGTVSFENLTKAEPAAQVKILYSVTGLAYTKTKDGALCPLAGTGSKTDGVMAGGQTLDAEDAEGSPLGIRIE